MLASTLLRSWPSSESLHHCPHTLYHKVVSKSGDNVAYVEEMYMNKQCQFEICNHHSLYYCLSCLFAFYGIPIFLTLNLSVKLAHHACE